MRTKDYITASYKILSETEDTKVVLASLRKYLEKRGLMKLYPSVLRGLIEKTERAEKGEGTAVHVAREKDIKKQASDITSALESHGLASEYKTEIDETLIGGYTITTKDTRIDQSYKHKLLTAYRALTD